MNLAEKIRAIERRHSVTNAAATTFGDDQRSPVIPTGWPDVDAALGGGLDGRALHEWIGLARLTTQASQASRRVLQSDRQATGESWIPPLCVLAHLAWQALEVRSFSLRAVWVGKRCFPYPRVLVRGSGKDSRLLERSIFVASRDTSSRLWAIDLALRSPVVGIVIADGSKFNMAAARRIQLAAKAGRTCAMLVRPPWERDELSAAQSRWFVQWESSPGHDSTFSVNPRWKVELLRCKGVRPEKAHGTWVLEWDRGKSVVRVFAPMADQACDPKSTKTNERSVLQSHKSA